MSELEYIQEIENRLQELFETAAAARDEAQKVLSDIIDIKGGLTKRQLEILKAQVNK